MQLRVKNFGLIKQWPRTNDGFIRLDGVTVFTSGNVDVKNLRALTTLIALFPQIEMDIEGIYHDIGIKDAFSI